MLPRSVIAGRWPMAHWQLSSGSRQPGSRRETHLHFLAPCRWGHSLLPACWQVNFWCVGSTVHRAPPLASSVLATVASRAANAASIVAAPMLESPRRRSATALIEARLAGVPGLRESNARLANRIDEDLDGLGWMMP